MSLATEYRCSHCRARNRIPEERLLDDPRCGRCRQPLFSREPVKVTDASFERGVRRESGLVTERVEMVQEEDGSWRVDSYEVRAAE